MTDWTDDTTADPVADLRAWADKVAAESGTYGPTRIFMSAGLAQAFANFEIWFAETKHRLDILPRRRFLTRMVLKRQLWGPWWKRSRRLTRLRWKIRDWRRGEDWDV